MARKHIALILVWALSLIIVAAIARAQTPAQRAPSFLEVISAFAWNVRVEVV